MPIRRGARWREKEERGTGMMERNAEYGTRCNAGYILWHTFNERKFIIYSLNKK